ncbi:hypothetical protein IVG45_21565 [Methylomonas sp. LL1]|uniref:hypothetical protein n=1 Tax=Methylomonas sp. LL1 TaxID=2785785 RepID=UPI0018C3D7B1|nr:hypothetical protein [Methylomonas sp. LL1]QPK63356.1 hypothetical protein IVG45_21565 [Methylomonas sp. LL1]
MQAKYPQNAFSAIVLFSAVLFSNLGYADTLMIDGFTHDQSITDLGSSLGSTGNTVNSLTGTDLINASRTFSAHATGSGLFAWEKITSEDGVLRIANGSRSAGDASIGWTFDPIDFTRYGNAILLEVKSIDLDVKVEMIANGISSSGLKTYNTAGDFLINFSDFSNSGVFSKINSFSMNFSGPRAWDGQFRLLTTTNQLPSLNTSTPVPLPPAFVMMGSVLLGYLGVSRRRVRS